MGQKAPYVQFFLGLAISLDLLVQMLQFDVRCIPLILRNVLHTHKKYSYLKTCFKMAPNNKLMSEVHSNASQEVIFEMAPFPSDIMQNIYFSLIFR